jgi:[pyruvate, water dikinase]-phosphate phosphotransferase / [pyruvate, water dikinase] kinase
MPNRTVFFVSDGTGITAETFGNSILAQFPGKPRHIRRPFVDTVDKAWGVVKEINQAAEREGKRPIIFVTLVDQDVRDLLTSESCKGMVLDMFRTFVEPLEEELGCKSNHRVGRSPDVSTSEAYTNRIDAINFTLAHDDGQSAENLKAADVVLVGVSRSGKTPTSLYLAMQHGIKAANYPLIPDDFERGPIRLSQVRNERLPGSKYATLENCRYEVSHAESMMRREGIAWLSSTHKSIEEISTTILRDIRPDRLIY